MIMTPRCQIKWVDGGEPTPDISPAEYLAVCTDEFTNGKHYFCCQKHFQMGKGYSRWKFIPLQRLINEVNTELAQKAYAFLTETLGA